MPWYMEIHAEYLTRYLSSDFHIETAFVPYPPFEDFLSRFPSTCPFDRNPDEYDLLWPILPTHWGVTDREAYAHKIVTVFYQPGEGRYEGLASVGASTPLAERSIANIPNPHRLRFGVDTNLFKPLFFPKDEKKMVVGMVGNLFNPRRMTKELLPALTQIDGVEFRLYLGKPPKTFHDMDFLGGVQWLPYIYGGDKSWPGLPNIYNSLDVLIRCDSDPGVSFPVLEASACGVPVIATDQGLDHEITGAGGGILIEADEKDHFGRGRNWYQANPDEVVKRVVDAVIYLRDHPNERSTMGMRGRDKIVQDYTWEQHIPAWREFFWDGYKKVKGIKS